MNATRRKTRDEVGLLGEDSAARIKRTLTVVPNTALDLYIPVPGCTFRGGNLIIIDYLRCKLWPINVFFRSRRIEKVTDSESNLLFRPQNNYFISFFLFTVCPSMNHLLSMPHRSIWKCTVCEFHSYTLMNSCCCGWWSGFYRGRFEVHVWPLSAGEESVPKEPQR